jgi:hypothetical protein
LRLDDIARRGIDEVRFYKSGRYSESSPPLRIFSALAVNRKKGGVNERGAV